MSGKYLELTGRDSGKPVFIHASRIVSFGADPDDHDSTRITFEIGTYGAYVTVTQQPDEIAETLGLKEITE